MGRTAQKCLFRRACSDAPAFRFVFPDRACATPCVCRLRKISAPSGSMERHHRRIAVLNFCKMMMEGRAAGVTGVCVGGVVM